jgi:hypothetical protein
MMKRVWVATLALLLVACASGPSSGQRGRDRNLITAEEIAALPPTNASDIVERLRPNWLRYRGPSSIRDGTPVVPIIYIDDIRSGSLQDLLRVRSEIIREIRYINGRDATTKWGLDHGGGVILVTTGR